MRAERYLQINMAVLAALGTVLLGMGQHDLRLPAIAVLAAGTSVYFTDILGWVRLNRIVANMAAIAAVGLCFSDFMRFDSRSQLIAIARLLIYLQIVLMFQPKHVRLYWQLFMLSLLQVVVGAALNLGLVFGFLLVIYLFVAVSALAVFFVYREGLRYRALVEYTTDDSPEFQHWASHSPAVAPLDSAALVGQPNLDVGQQTLGWGLFRRTVRGGMLTLGIAALVFIMLPRSGKGVWSNAPGSFRSVVGYSSGIRLGDSQNPTQDTQPVMQVKFVDQNSGQPIKLIDEPLLRGTVVSQYSSGSWSDHVAGRAAESSPLSAAPNVKQLVRQEITIEPLGEPVLFSVYPAFQPPGRQRSGVQVNRNELELTGPEERTGQFSYAIATTGIAQANQQAIVPALGEATWLRHRESHLLRMPGMPHGPDPLARLRTIAKQVLDESELPVNNRVARARAMERYLSSSRFTYSLRRDAADGVDPIEDFVADNPKGHCEYFASALALMLRSQGIPARIALGFRGGDWNNVGGFYQFRQLHAHAWVEVLLEPEHVLAVDPGFELTPDAPGYWLRLDPTPSTAPPLLAGGSLFNTLADIGDYFQLLWSRHVVGMNAQQQEAAIYQPLIARLQKSLAGVYDSVAKWLSALVGGYGASGEWLDWRGGLIGMLLILTLVLIKRGVVFAARVVVSWVRRRRAEAALPERVRVEFYERLESLLARHGFHRGATQTAHEFVGAVGATVEWSGGRRSNSLARRLVQSFYRVRYGGQSLTPDEREQVEQELAELQQALRGRPADRLLKQAVTAGHLVSGA